ncbi:MAG: response regulator transcription factor [Lachnospiraceae bacterium]|nr:response regulator transcription factor [Lachnospiraceae bacterium]
MRIVICDDDKLIRTQLEKLVRDFFTKSHLKCPEIAVFPDGESLLQDALEKDIVFLDVEMPGLDGIYVGRELKHHNKNVIIFIVTSFVEYLDDAMRFHVFRYLSKPLEKYRFFRNMEDALQLYNTFLVKIAIDTKTGVYTVSSSEIIFVEAQMRKVLVHTIAQTYESTQNMAYWIKQLDAKCFFQAHRSFIVNMEHITSFDHSVIYLFHNQFRAYLTRRKYTEFKEAYLLYLESVR